MGVAAFARIPLGLTHAEQASLPAAAAKLPGEHNFDATLWVGQYDPGLQLAHESGLVPPVSPRAVPAMQGRGAGEPSGQYAPSSQRLQRVCPFEPWNQPALHSRQDPCAGASWKVPLLQASGRVLCGGL